MKTNKIFAITCLLILSVVGVQGQNWKYPRVENGNTIVSRDAAGGIKGDALLTTTQKKTLIGPAIYNEQSPLNKVSAKFEVASTDASTLSAWGNAYIVCRNYSTGAAAGSWRLPTQRELMLIWMFKPKLTSCGSITSAGGGFWSGAEDSSNSTSAWHVNFVNGHTTINTKTTTNFVRCVRDL